MNVTRRQALASALFGAGALGLRALATGLPVSFFLNPRRAAAQGACTDASKAQYIVFSTGGGGDPINASVPGTYADQNIVHSPDAAMAATSFTMLGKPYTAARPWTTLPQSVLDRTVYWHLMTNTPIHPKEPDVLRLNGASQGHEMLPSLLAKAIAPCLNTIQAQPLSIGAATPSEALSYSGSTLPVIPPLALKATLTSPTGPLTQLQKIRDDSMAKVYALYRNGATPAEQAYIDSLTNTQQQMRLLNQALLDGLSKISDNLIGSQILAAVTLIRMNVAPVISIHVPFGGDNHADAGLVKETAETISGVAAIGSLMQQLQSAGLQDKVTFMTLNVFSRTLRVGNSGASSSALSGRAHNQYHQVSVTIGKPFKGGVVGGCEPVGGDYGATGIDSATGMSSDGGDILPVETLGAFAKSMLSAVGGDPSSVTQGKVVTSALA
jgi:hypothetical protein